MSRKLGSRQTLRLLPREVCIFCHVHQQTYVNFWINAYWKSRTQDLGPLHWTQDSRPLKWYPEPGTLQTRLRTPKFLSDFWDPGPLNWNMGH